jgi:repressor LexA
LKLSHVRDTVGPHNDQGNVRDRAASPDSDTDQLDLTAEATATTWEDDVSADDRTDAPAGEPAEVTAIDRGHSTSRRRGARQRGGEPELRAVTAVVSAFPDLFTADLTVRQRRILEFIRAAVERNGYPPSVREIGEAVGLVSPSSVAYQLKELERKGYLRRDPNRPRAVDVLGLTPATCSAAQRIPAP